MTTIPAALAIAIQHHQNGNLQAAEQIYRQILAVEPKQAERALHLLGVMASQVGKPEVAVEYISRAIALQGNHGVLHNNLGEAYRALHRMPEAIACYRRALELDPGYAEAHSNLGIALLDQGMPDDAVASWRRALELKPDLAQAHANLGIALKGQGKLDQAIDSYRRAVELKPNFAEAHANLGNALQEQGKADQAIASWRRALELKPDFFEACDSLAGAFKEQGRLDEAIACWRRALEIEPDHAETHSNLGNALQEQGQPEEAIACHRRALELAPECAEIHGNLGNVLSDLGRLEEAIACYRRVLELKPGSAEAHSNLGNTLKAQGKLEEAIACYRRAVELKPDLAEAHGNMGVALKDQGNLDEAAECYRRALDLKPEFAQAHGNMIYTQLFSPACDAEAIFDEHRRWNLAHAAPLAKFITPHGNDRSPHRRLRIGYVSPNFCNHCQALFTVPLFSAHDHQDFEIVCYSDAARGDSVTERLQSSADLWRSTAGLGDAALAERIREDGIDILVDLSMHMAGNRLLVFARKPAPVQACWLAYPGTTGLSAIDYRITDLHLDPPGLFDRWYSEQSVRLPDTFWCYDPLDSEAGVGPLPAAANGYITFGCLNNFCKVNPPVLKIWAKVLRAVDRSRLILLAGEGTHRQRTLDMLAEEGVADDRLTFVGRRPRQEYLRLYAGIDIGLDTVPYNGHTTSLDSYWMGVPVVSLVGATVVGRAGLSQLTNLGLGELAAASPERYVRIAVELARDLSRLGNLRATLRARMQSSPLMDAPRFAGNLEAAYRAMWQRWCTEQ